MLTFKWLAQTIMFVLAVVCLDVLGAEDQRFKVITTFTVIADIAQNIAGDVAVVESITKPNAEIHNYQTTPGDIRRAQGANLIIYNGFNLELWFDRFFHNLNDIPKVVVTEGIEPIGIRSGPYTGKPNPHAWMSAPNAIIYIENIRRAMVRYDTANAATYTANAKQYTKRLLDTLEPYKALLSSISDDKRWLVSSEGAFSYLARDYGLKELYLWPMNSDGQGTPQQVRRVIDSIRKHNIGVIFSESTVPSKPAKQVARETDARYGGVLFVDSLSDEDGPVPTYLSLLTTTLSTIAEGLAE